jgi:hypothetical protein
MPPAAHGVQKVVLMTAMGADADPTRRCARPNCSWSVGAAVERDPPQLVHAELQHLLAARHPQQGKIQLPTGKAKGSFIDARDIAAVAASLLHAGRSVEPAFDLTGSEALDHDQVAALLSRETGGPFATRTSRPRRCAPGCCGAGLPAATPTSC